MEGVAAPGAVDEIQVGEGRKPGAGDVAQVEVGVHERVEEVEG